MGMEVQIQCCTYSILLASAGSMLCAIPSLLDIYTIDAHLIHFQF